MRIRVVAWEPIDDNTPKNEPIWVYCPAREGLNEFISLCQWHEDAGFCVCEIRYPTHWMPREILTPEEYL